MSLSDSDLDRVGNAADLTNEYFQRFMGGQMEVYDTDLGVYRYRGEISEIKLQDGRLSQKFSWYARALKPREQVTNWVRALHTECSVTIVSWDVSGDGDSLTLASRVIGERMTFYPPGSDKLLDPKAIQEK